MSNVWTASGIGGCALNPRLLFPNTPGHPGEALKSAQRPIEPDALDVILRRFRLIGPARPRYVQPATKYCERKLPFAHGETDHRQSYATHLQCTY